MATDTPVTEFIFLPAKPTVLPWDEGNAEGKALLDLLTKKKSLFRTVLWARAIDKEDTIGVAVELLPGGGSFPLSTLEPFQSSEPRTLFVRAEAADFVRNPVTEVAVLPLDLELTVEEKAAMSDASGTFGKALLGAPAPVKYADGTMCLAYKSSWAAGPPENRLIMMIGWREVENHVLASKTVVFQDNLKPIADRLAEPFDVTHFTWLDL